MTYQLILEQCFCCLWSFESHGTTQYHKFPVMDRSFLNLVVGKVTSLRIFFFLNSYSSTSHPWPNTLVSVPTLDPFAMTFYWVTFNPHCPHFYFACPTAWHSSRLEDLLSTIDPTLPHPTSSLRGQIKQRDELLLKIQFVVGMGTEPEQVHEDVRVLHGKLQSDIVWGLGSCACWASSRDHGYAHTIAFPERQTLP